MYAKFAGNKSKVLVVGGYSMSGSSIAERLLRDNAKVDIEPKCKVIYHWPVPREKKNRHK